MFWRHPVLSVTALAYLVFVLWLTLTPEPFGAETISATERIAEVLRRLPATDWVTGSMVERAANVALFVPVGGLFLLAVGLRYWFVAVGLGAALSMAIEAVQAVALPTRVADPMDVAMNSVGTVIGVAGVAALTWGTERRHRTIQRQRAQLEAANREIERLSRARETVGTRR